jgi:hypothetical protein
MSPAQPREPDDRVFDWLGTDARGVPYYLHPLNLVWTDAGVEHDLAVYRRVSALLAAEPEYWTQIIREVNWRFSLAGCACLLAARRRAFYQDLCFRFKAGSWVTPQIAITIGLLHPAPARAFFESVLADPALRPKPKQAVSAHRGSAPAGHPPGERRPS